MLRLLGRSLLASSLLLGAACATDDDADLDTGAGKADQISGNDDPSGILRNAERTLDKLITRADIGETFGLDDDKVPYPDTYWPMVDDGIAVTWVEQSGEACASTNACDDPQPSPLAKYMQLMDPANAEAATAWEIEHHGSKVPNVADWFGHCPGWTAAATTFAPITRPLLAARSGSGVRRCIDGEEGCVKFEIGDLNALQAEVYNNARSGFIGARCDTEPSKIERDEFGRIVRTGAGCQGLNPGAMLIVATNMLKLDKQAFGVDAQNEFNSDQIWNQPAYRYTVNHFEELTRKEAANLVAHGTKTGDQTKYLWNSLARDFVLVDFTMHWVTETPGPNTEVVSGLDSSKETRMVAVIELDRDSRDPEAQIIGGELIDDEDAGADRLRNHPFVWKAFSVGPDDGRGHNPFVKGGVVNQLVQLALEDE